MAITTAKAAKGVMVFTADAIGLLRDFQDQVYRRVRQRALARAAADNRELVTAEDIAAEIGPVLRDMTSQAAGSEATHGTDGGPVKDGVAPGQKLSLAQFEATLGGSPEQREAMNQPELPNTGAPNAAADSLSRDR